MKRRSKLKRNILLSWEIYYSEAFQALSATEIRVFLRFLQKRSWVKTRGRKKNVVFDNTGLVFTYSEAMELGVKRSTFHKSIKKLVHVGFIDVEHQGGWVGRDYSRYSISERWRDYGTPAFREIIKKRVLWSGHDVRSWQEKKESKKGT